MWKANSHWTSALTVGGITLIVERVDGGHTAAIHECEPPLDVIRHANGMVHYYRSRVAAQRAAERALRQWLVKTLKALDKAAGVEVEA